MVQRYSKSPVHSPVLEILEPRLLLDAVPGAEPVEPTDFPPLTILAASDAYEVDDSGLSSKSILTDGTPQVHSFHTSSDVDWVRFLLGQTMHLVIETDGTAGDTEMWLYGPNDYVTEMAYDDDGGNGSFSRIDTVLGSAWYFLKVSEYYGDTVDAYTIQVTATPVVPDSYEPDNLAASATLLAPNGVAQSHSIHIPGDVDWAEFRLNQPAHVQLEIDGGTDDMEAWLYGPNSAATEIAYADNWSGGTFGFSQGLQAGTYYAKIAAYSGSDVVDSYTVSLTSTTGGGDAYEIDDSSQWAHVIGTNGTRQMRSIHVPGDTDWAKFTLAHTSAVTIETDGASGSTEMWLYGPDDPTWELDYDDGDWGWEFASIVRTAADPLAPGTYYVEVTDFEQDDVIADYSLSVTAVPLLPDAYEPDNTGPQATLIAANGSSQTHSFHEAADVDWLRFSLTTTSGVWIETSGDFGGDTEMWLYGSNSYTSEIAYDDEGGVDSFSRIVESGLAPGTYYVKVSEYYGDTLASYDISVSRFDSGPDAYESDNTSAQARSITTDGAAQTHSIHAAGDTDWVRFTLADPSEILIETDGPAGSTEMWLYAAGDLVNELDYDDGDWGWEFASIGSDSVGVLDPGTYYVKVAEYDNDEAIPIYTITVDAKPVIPDAWENDDDPAAAGPIPTDGSAQQHSIHVAGDVDWVRFDVTEQSAAVLETAGAAGDTEIALYRDGDFSSSIAYDDDGGAGSFSRIVFDENDPLSPGTYYLEVAAYGWDEVIDSYTISVTVEVVDPFVEILDPISGQYVAGHLDLGWRDVHESYSADIRFYIDLDSDPNNGVGHTLLTTAAEDPDAAGDTALVALPAGYGPRAEPYYVWGRMADAGDTYDSNVVPILVVDRMVRQDDPWGDAYGGDAYEVYGMEVAMVGDLLYFRARTDYDPLDDGGDVYINVGATHLTSGGIVSGIAVNAHATDKDPVVPGDLYRHAEFEVGTEKPDIPTFIKDYADHLAGNSAIAVTVVADLPWYYEISGFVDTNVLPGWDPALDVEVLWSMYCGNDTALAVMGGVVPVEDAAVVGRHVFYNRSTFDGNDPLPNAGDDAAIAPDKVALLPDQTAMSANYTSYSRGINGIMIDIAGLAGTPTAADFEFKVGNSNDPDTWATAPAPASITVRFGEGTDGGDRVTLIWDDNAIQKSWLQVTVKATANTGLAEDDVFYFGNAIGETGNSEAEALVNANDVVGTRDNPHGPFNRAMIDDAYDFNRDRLVNATDVILARDNQTSPFTMLKLITVPAMPAGSEGGRSAAVDTSFADDPVATEPSGASIEPTAAVDVFADQTPEPISTTSSSESQDDSVLLDGLAVLAIEPLAPVVNGGLDSEPDPAQPVGLADAGWTGSQVQLESVLTALEPLELDPLKV